MGQYRGDRTLKVSLGYQRDLIHRELDRICDQPDRVVY
ncbi:hypothetical protein NIES2098_71890 [Calothrix sp. NIES-2098]|nr:hypothetical protein NIES2098_71890 [Calothrix sp. NIES-2098]